MKRSPQQTTRFFRQVWRINGILICLAGVGACLAIVGGLLIVLVSELTRTRSKDETRLVRQDATHSDWHLGNFESLTGAETLYASVTLEQEWRGSFRGKETSGICNYLFVRTTDKSSHFLLPDNKSILRELRPLRGKQERVEWLYCQRTALDSNKDGRIDQEDPFAVGFARPDGTDYREVLGGIDAVLGETRRGTNTFLLVYRQKQNIQIAEIDIPSRKVLVSKPLPPLGN